HVLGVLLARAADRPLETLLRERLLGPLGMADTHFTVPPEKLGRFADCYRFDPDAGLMGADHDSAWLTPPSFPEAASGLVSTADDYLAFGRMLLAGGVHDGARLISQASVAEMTTDQLTAAQRRDGAMFLDGRGWGLGMSTPPAGQAGPYGWDGGFGTSWRSDPRAGLTAILLTQRLFDPDPGPAYGAFHGALDSSAIT
ncbi:MAG: serine hydrolase domain-containing protein, partial [Phenylobacterium sp.]